MEDTVLQLTLETLVQVLFPVVLGGLVWLVKELIASVRANIKREHIEIAERLIRNLVRAAEQNGLVGVLVNEGKAKKKWVLDQLELALARRGINLDLDELDALIEGIFYDEIGSWKDLFQERRG